MTTLLTSPRRETPPPRGSSRRRAADGAATGLTDYLGSIAAYPLLSAAEERELAIAIKSEDRGVASAARSTLIRSNLRLVVKVATAFRNRGLPLEDLVAEGNLGLIRAAEDYDPASHNNARFSTYAYRWIAQSIRQALVRTAAPIRLPHTAMDLLTRWQRAEASIAAREGGPPAFDRVADGLGLTASQRELAARAVQSRRFLPGGQGHCHDELGPDGTLEGIPAPGPAVPEIAGEAEAEAIGLARLDDAVSALPDRERYILARRYGLGGGPGPATLREIAGEIGVTKERVRQLEAKAFKRLRGSLGGPGTGEVRS